MRCRGFVLTLDVIIALIIASFLVASIMYLVTQPKINVFDYLYKVALDFLTVAEKDGSLNAAVNGNSSRLNDFIASMPDTLCMNVTIYDNSSGIVYTNSSDCPAPVTYVMAWRSFMNGTDFYMASGGVWRK
jgi:hypothetical protein